MCICCLAGSRRDFLAAAAMALPLAACAAAAEPKAVDTVDDPETPPDNGVEVSATTIRIPLEWNPELVRENGSLVVPEASTIVIHVGATDDYRAFSNVCTHAGCGIWIFAAPRMRCGCHGSEFDVAGGAVVGPAALPLKRYEVTRDGATLIVARA